MENSIERLTGSVVAIQSSHHGQPDECVPSGFKYLEGGVVGVSKEILSSVAINSLPLSSVPVASGPVSRETISLGKRVTSCDLPVAESVGSSAVVEALSVGSGISVGSNRYITDSQTNIPQNENYSDGACGGLTNNFRLSERKDIGSANIETVTSNASALTIIDNARPKRTEMASKIKRLKSFTSKNNIYQRKEDLSLAGFYYVMATACGASIVTVDSMIGKRMMTFGLSIPSGFQSVHMSLNKWGNFSFRLSNSLKLYRKRLLLLMLTLSWKLKQNLSFQRKGDRCR
uniref:Uncharacterized protein n=1 Tax=Biomphalaria glabrata TaxID=6526 RepID=A0A2C9KK28_BIOGL